MGSSTFTHAVLTDSLPFLYPAVAPGVIRLVGASFAAASAEGPAQLSPTPAGASPAAAKDRLLQITLNSRTWKGASYASLQRAIIISTEAGAASNAAPAFSSALICC